MKKIPKCKGCGDLGHYKINCTTTARTPIARTPIARKANDFKTLSSKPKAYSSITKKPKTVSRRKSAVGKLDKIFSIYIRKRRAHNLFVTCVTCNRPDLWFNMQNGHFIPRGKVGTRWDEINCNVQCPECNEGLSGNLAEYELYLIAEHGEGIIEELQNRSRIRITTTEIEDMIILYQRKLDELSTAG